MRKRTWALAGLVAMAVTGVWLVQRLNADQRYRGLLADGERALEGGRPQEAIEAFSGALALRPTSMVGHFRRGEAFAANSEEDRAMRDLQQARRLMPEAPEPLEALGRLADAQGNPAEAATWYAQAAERLKVTDARLLYALALARYRAGSPAAARAPLKQALARNPAMAEGHYLLGLVLRDTHEPDEAAAALEQAIRLTPTMVAAREELADLYRDRRQAADELRQLRALTTLDNQTERYVALALGALRAGKSDEALAALAQAEARDANDSGVALAFGRVHLASAERNEDRTAVTRALTALERALGGTARRSEGLALYGRALYLAGDAAGAERLLKDAILTSPVDPEAYTYLADAAERLGHHAVARDALIKLDAMEGDTVAGLTRAERARRIGTLALGAGDPRLGATYLDTAIKAGVADAATFGLLARAKWQAGDRDGARTALGQALALDSADSDLRRLGRTIR